MNRLVFALRNASPGAHVARLGPSRNDADAYSNALADLHTRSRQVAYRDLYGDAYLDHELAAVSRASWRARFEDFDLASDLILAAMEDGAPVGLAYASFRIDPDVGLLIDNLNVAPERKGGVEVARYAEIVPGGREVDTVRYRWDRPDRLLD